MTLDTMPQWIPILKLSIADLPRMGQVGGGYELRDATTRRIKYIGGTQNYARRFFGNYLGGVGGGTTKRIHEYLFSGGWADNIEVAWFPDPNCRSSENNLKAIFKKENGGELPEWNRR